MQFSIEREPIFRELQRANRVVPPRSTLPILTCVLLTLQGSKLRITSTDIEVTVETEIDVNGSVDGQVAIPSKILNDIIGALPQGELTFSVDENNKVTLGCSSGSYSIAGRSPEDFPAIPSVEERHKVELENEAFHRIIDRTLFAVSPDALRPALTGVSFEFASGTLHAVATDGHRLAKYTINQLPGAPFEARMIVPQKFLSLVSNPLLNNESNTFLVGENHVKMVIDNTNFYSRIIDEKYPDYNSVIPVDNDKEIRVNVNDILSSVVRVSIFANKTTHQVKLSISGNKISISTSDIESGGSASEDVACTYSGEDIDIGFNSKYLRDILRQVDTEEMLLKIKTPISAGLVYPSEDKEGENYTILLMPIRLTDES